MNWKERSGDFEELNRRSGGTTIVVLVREHEELTHPCVGFDSGGSPLRVVCFREQVWLEFY